MDGGGFGYGHSWSSMKRVFQRRVEGDKRCCGTARDGPEKKGLKATRKTDDLHKKRKNDLQPGKGLCTTN